MNLPIEIILNICENIYIIDDLINLYKSNKFFKKVIDTHKNQILKKLFNQKSFSNSYYNLFYSYVNNRYEGIKEEPFKHLKQLILWEPSSYSSDSLFNFNFAKNQLFVYITTKHKIFRDDNLDIFRDCLQLICIPSYYIIDSSKLLYKFFNTRGLVNVRNRDTVIVSLKKKLFYLDIKFNNDDFYFINNYDVNYDFNYQLTIFDYLLDIYPDILIYHILNFQKIITSKKFNRLLHSIVLNLFLEWLFENECAFIEKFFSKLYIYFPQFMQKTVYKLIYNEFDTNHDIFTERFVDHFFELHRIYLPISKISKLYNLLNLKEYKEFRINSSLDWKRHLKRLEIY